MKYDVINDMTYEHPAAEQARELDELSEKIRADRIQKGLDHEQILQKLLGLSSEESVVRVAELKAGVADMEAACAGLGWNPDEKMDASMEGLSKPEQAERMFECLKGIVAECQEYDSAFHPEIDMERYRNMEAEDYRHISAGDIAEIRQALKISQEKYGAILSENVLKAVDTCLCDMDQEVGEITDAEMNADEEEALDRACALHILNQKKDQSSNAYAEGVAAGASEESHFWIRLYSKGKASLHFVKERIRWIMGAAVRFVTSHLMGFLARTAQITCGFLVFGVALEALNAGIALSSFGIVLTLAASFGLIQEVLPTERLIRGLDRIVELCRTRWDQLGEFVKGIHRNDNQEQSEITMEERWARVMSWTEEENSEIKKEGSEDERKRIIEEVEIMA